jgi:prevent-host-death family protein
MKQLQLRQAKTTLSVVVEAAEKGEPTTITKHGRPAAVVVSHAEWTRLKTRIPSFADFLLAVPPLDRGAAETSTGPDCAYDFSRHVCPFLEVMTSRCFP